MFNTNVKYPLKYLKVSDGKRLHIETYPCWGPGANVTGLRKLYNLNDALHPFYLFHNNFFFFIFFVFIFIELKFKFIH